MKKNLQLLFFLLFIGSWAYCREYHVSVKGNDANTGTEAAPFRTINRAAQAAYPGDVVTVHAGTYREWVNPPRGGNDENTRIVYHAAPNERVEIKGSEIVNNWTKEQNGVWKVVLPNSFFGDYNPYVDVIYGDWFDKRKRIHHTGEVFLNNKSLYEKETLDKVLNPTPNTALHDPDGSTYTWYCESDEKNVTIWANFHKYNPNKELVEISARRTCFYPETQGVNYLTIRGFHISQAATQWAAPTAEQIGMIATHWNKGWIIENNVVSNSKCSGITLGKERSTGHNSWLEDTSVDGSLSYIEVTFRTLRNGWNKDRIGSHIVRNNEIFSCEQTGICGSMGAAFSIIENNYIHDIYEKRQFSGFEMAGIKFHAAIDTQIRNNRIRRAGRGIWMDWMAQGARITGNVMYENDQDDIYFEVDHGPHLVDNNILCSPVNIFDMSHGGAYVHNIFAGCIRVRQERGRYTPYHLPHQTDIAGLSIILNGDNRFYNNLFMPVNPDEKQVYGLAAYDKTGYPNFIDGNAYYGKATPLKDEKNFVLQADFNPDFRIEETAKEVFVSFNIKGLNDPKTEMVSTERLGKAKFPKQYYETPDGAPILFDRDYLGLPRTSAHPVQGPFSSLTEGANRVKVWDDRTSLSPTAPTAPTPPTAPTAPTPLSFRPDGKFVIMQMTDIHWTKQRKRMWDMLKLAIDTVRPDLIIVTGDVVTGSDTRLGWEEITAPLAASGIPWAVTFGNHDTEHELTKPEILSFLSTLPGNLTVNGPEDVSGNGNYVLEIASSKTPNKIAAALYCFDSRQQDNWIDFTQINWYRQQSNQLKASNAGVPLPSLAFFHIPIPEYRLITEKPTTVGVFGEPVCDPPLNSGLFAAFAEQGDVMGMFVGHDHLNNYIGVHHNVALAYGYATTLADTGFYCGVGRGVRVVELTEGVRTFATWLVKTCDEPIGKQKWAVRRKAETIYRVVYPDDF
jgi:hypothetical protein